MHILDYDGGLVDASCIAVIAALQHFRRPDVSVKGEDVIVYTLTERVPVPLSMLHHPLCVTLSFFDRGDVALVDTTLVEQQLCEAEMVVTANKHGEVCQVAKLGGAPTDAVELLRWFEVALSKVRELDKLICSALEQDARRRNVGGIVSELSAENER